MYYNDFVQFLHKLHEIFMNWSGEFEKKAISKNEERYGREGFQKGFAQV